MLALLAAVWVAFAQDGDVDRIMNRFRLRQQQVKSEDEFRRLVADTRVEFEGFLKANPAHKDAHRAAYHVAETYITLRQYDPAHEKLKAFLKDYPGSENVSTARFALAEVLLQMEKDAEARAAFDEFAQLYPKDDRALYARLYKAVTFQNERKYDEAVEILQAVRKEHRDKRESWGALMQLAVVFHVQEKNTDARRVLEEIIRDCPDREPVEIARRHLTEYLKVGNEPPGFIEKDLDGREVSLDKLRGKVAIVYFFDPGQAAAATETAFIRRTKRLNSKPGQPEELMIVGVSMSPDRKDVALFKEYMQLDWPLLHDPKGIDGKIPRLWGVATLPSLTVLDRKGRIRYFNVAGRDLRNCVAKLLEEK